MNNEKCRAPEVVVASSKSQREVSMAVVAEAGVVSPGGEYLQCDRLTRPMHAKWSVGEKATKNVGQRRRARGCERDPRQVSPRVKECGAQKTKRQRVASNREL